MSSRPLATPSRSAVGLLGAGLLMLTCHGTQTIPSSPVELAGCWSLETGRTDGGPWEPVDPARLPEAVRLDSVRIGAGYGAAFDSAYRAWSIVDGGLRDHPFRAWRLVDADSVWIGHPAAYSGYTLRLGPVADTLTGRLVVHSDVLGDSAPPPRPARLVRNDCAEGLAAPTGARPDAAGGAR